MNITPPVKIISLLLLVIYFFSFESLARAQSLSEDPIVLILPVSGQVVIGKKPKISFTCSESLSTDGLLVLLDGNDITALLTNEGITYSYVPLTPLVAGSHELQILAYAEDGKALDKTFSFTSRQSESFEEIYSNSTLSATFKTIADREYSSDGTTLVEDIPYTSFDSYLSNDSGIKEGKWETTSTINARYIDQNSALLEPEKKGLGLINFLVAGSYTGQTISSKIEIGDATIEESVNTIDYLTRRGGKISFSSNNVTLNGFGVMSTETPYKVDGLGLAFNSNDHIMGTSAKVDFLEKRMSLKGIYARGGEKKSGFGTWSETEGHKGDVAGVVLITDFFDELFVTEFEFDTTNHDIDTSDTVEEESDKAYRIKISGLSEVYDYEMSYSYTGPQFDVVGNQSIVKDWEGFDFISGLTTQSHRAQLLLNYSWDNVEDDIIFARIYSFTSGIDYIYSGFTKFPMTLLLTHNTQRSEDEPLGSLETSLDTSTVTGGVGYIDGPWSVEIKSSYSDQNDKTLYNYDTELITFSVVPSYIKTTFSILPSWSFNRSKDLFTDVETDTHTLTLDIYSSFIDDSVTCELGGTYDWTEADDASVEMNNASYYGKLNYIFDELWGFKDSTIALEYKYTHQEDELLDSKIYDSVLTLVLSSAFSSSY